MKRRDFIRTSALSTAFVAGSGLWSIRQVRAGNLDDLRYVWQSARDVPVAYDVDVVVVGGSTAAVSAATSAAKLGAKVFLVAQEPYLGEDICGTYRLWPEPLSAQSVLGQKIFGEGLPTPMHVKRTLDRELIEYNISFLYSGFVTDVVTDDAGNLGGVVIANRSGRQVVLAKTIIDATPRAMVARMTSAKFSGTKTGKRNFEFTVVGNSPKTGERINAVEKFPEPIKVGEKSYTALRYSLRIDMPDNSWVSYARAEQVARDLTWDADQVESADLLFEVPSDFCKGEIRVEDVSVSPESVPVQVFQPYNVPYLFVLSGSADVSRELAAFLLKPAYLIASGEKVGAEAERIAQKRGALKNLKIAGKPILTEKSGNVGELLSGIRPSAVFGFVHSEETSLPVLARHDVIVMGGGTAGAPAALSAAQHGASTLVIDYMHGLGGVGTLGMIGRYYHGYRHGFTNEVDKGVRALGGDDNPRQKQRLDEWVFDWKTEWLRREIHKAGGEIWFGVIGIGAYTENNQVIGVVVATPMGRGVILGHTVIDSSGSADIAIAAGAAYSYTDALSVAVQGAGLPSKKPDDFYNNTDWTFTDDTDLMDVWMTFVVGKEKFKDQFDIGKLPQTRERRRMVGDFTISVLDVYNGRTYLDTISIHESAFDTHGFTIDPFFALKPPKGSGIDVKAYVPFRALLPKGLEGIIVTGLGVSAHRDAMPVIRMQPCLQNQGYAVGWAAAMASENNQMIRYIDLKKLQQELVLIENLTGSVLTDVDNYPPSDESIRLAALQVVNDLNGLETVLWNKDKGISEMARCYQNDPDAAHKLVYARILGMLDDPTGWTTLFQAVSGLERWDEGWNYRGMGQFGMSMSYVDSLVIALGKTRRQEALPAIVRMAKMLTPESEFSHFRAVAQAFESLLNHEAAKILFEMLQMPGMTGHALTDIKQALEETPASSEDTSLRNSSLKELFWGRALFKCGDYNGLGKQILQNYSNDLRGHYARHASGVLQMFQNASVPDVNL